MKNLYSGIKGSITIPPVHTPASVVNLIADRGVSTNSVEIIPHFPVVLKYNTYGNHGVGHGLIFGCIENGYFGRIRVDLVLL